MLINFFYLDTIINIRKAWLKYASNTNEVNEQIEDPYFNEILEKLKALKSHDQSKFLGLDKMLLNMLSKRTASFDKYCEYLQYSSEVSPLMHDFNMANTSRKWKFNKYTAKKRVMLYLILKFYS